MKPLVVYYSKPGEQYVVGVVDIGNTEVLAKEIIGAVGADEFKIEPQEPYPKGYMDTVNQATEEIKQGTRPAYVGDIELANYDPIYLGYPIWWGDLPPIVYTFLEKHDLTGKTIIPFNTHEGSGNSNTYERLQQKFPAATFMGGGFNLTGHEARTKTGLAKLGRWLQGLYQ